MPKVPDGRFAGFQSPNYTPVPDELFDELLPDLGEAELRVPLYIVRRTFGFKKDSDSISLSQMIGGITTRDRRLQPDDRALIARELSRPGYLEERCCRRAR